MKVKLLVAMSGPGYTRIPGDVAEVEDAEALRLIDARYAEPVAETPAERRENAASKSAAKRESRAAAKSAAEPTPSEKLQNDVEPIT